MFSWQEIKMKKFYKISYVFVAKKMKLYIGILLIIIIAFFFSCAKEGPEEVDKIPPTNPHLIPHLGDPGDDTVSTFLTDEGNGIDAVSAGPGEQNYIQIMWNYLPDDDLHHIIVYRFSNEDSLSVVDVLYNTQDTVFIDEFNTYTGHRLYPKIWSYYIQPYDEAGNSSISDTVRYGLLVSPMLTYPPDEHQISGMDTLLLAWNKGSISENASSVRVLIFNSDHSVYWHYDIDPMQSIYSIEVDDNLIRGQTYYWRVDVFFEDGFGGKYGSESEERTIIVQ